MFFFSTRFSRCFFSSFCAPEGKCFSFSSSFFFFVPSCASLCGVLWQKLPLLTMSVSPAGRLILWTSTETQHFVRPHVSTFLSKYWRYCFDKHTNGKICSWRSSLGKLHSESMSFDKGLTLWVRAGASRALQEKSWSFLVPGEATKPIFSSWLLSSLTPFHAPSRSRCNYAWRWT